jgi:hypothetical protein
MSSSEKKPQTATAPEASTSEIITEAEKPSKLPRVAVLAPEQSVRPKRRSIKIKLDKEQSKQTEQTIDPLAAALNEALTGSTNESESEASTESQKNCHRGFGTGNNTWYAISDFTVLEPWSVFVGSFVHYGGDRYGTFN